MQGKDIFVSTNLRLKMIQTLQTNLSYLQICFAIQVGSFNVAHRILFAWGQQNKIWREKLAIHNTDYITDLNLKEKLQKFMFPVIKDANVVSFAFLFFEKDLPTY